MEYIIKKGSKDSGIHFNPFIGNVIEGTAILTSSALYDTSKMTPRESSSYQKITGIADLFNFNTRSGRLGYRMDMRGNEMFELSTYLHINQAYNPVNYPGKHICYVEADQEFYYRVEYKNYQFIFTVNDIVVKEDFLYKINFPILMYPYYEAGDKAADHDMSIIINRK